MGNERSPKAENRCCRRERKHIYKYRERERERGEGMMQNL